MQKKEGTLDGAPLPVRLSEPLSVFPLCQKYMEIKENEDAAFAAVVAGGELNSFRRSRDNVEGHLFYNGSPPLLFYKFDQHRTYYAAAVSVAAVAPEDEVLLFFRV